ncbi:MAG: SDR family oxidoreductase [Ilumatobacteraceae bacterium]|nr:SDR family oxidoreductase [Ilumatobacteraceae bacterium]
MNLNDKVTLVTGAGQGIGKGIADSLAEYGAHVIIAEINETTGKEAAVEIESRGGSAEAIQLDVTDYDLVKEAINAVVAQHGRIDVLVNNAGWDLPEPFLVSTPDTWAKVIAINYLGVVHTCHAALPHMIEAGRGRIVNIGSDAGRVGSSGEAVYSGAKGGVIAFSKTVAREVARKGIGINVVCPGPTDTPLVADLATTNEGLVKALERAIPMGRLGQPSDLGAAVAFMASDAAGFITGQTLSVSGGLTMA